MFTAEIWQSHKDLGNDDCYTGGEFGSLEEARKELVKMQSRYRWAYACIEGPEGRVQEETNPNYKPEPDDNSLDRSEFAAMQAMSFGVDAYNEARGFDTDEPEEFSLKP